MLSKEKVQPWQATCVTHPNSPACYIDDSRQPHKRICVNCAFYLKSEEQGDLKSFPQYANKLHKTINQIELSRIQAHERKDMLIGQINAHFNRLRTSQDEQYSLLLRLVQEEQRSKQSLEAQLQQMADKLIRAEQHCQYLKRLSQNNLVRTKILVSSRQGLKDFVNIIIELKQFKQKKHQYLQEVKSLLQEKNKFNEYSFIRKVIDMLHQFQNRESNHAIELPKQEKRSDYAKRGKENREP